MALNFEVRSSIESHPAASTRTPRLLRQIPFLSVKQRSAPRRLVATPPVRSYVDAYVSLDTIRPLLAPLKFPPRPTLSPPPTLYTSSTHPRSPLNIPRTSSLAPSRRPPPAPPSAPPQLDHATLHTTFYPSITSPPSHCVTFPTLIQDAAPPPDPQFPAPSLRATL